MRGTFYDGLFHVTDWVPTILEFADITYDAEDGYELDGVSQVAGFADGKSIRENMLYNYYTNAEHTALDMWTNAPLAIRKDQ
jgi:arylsulfatase A-like enzyme